MNTQSQKSLPVPLQQLNKQPSMTLIRRVSYGVIIKNIDELTSQQQSESQHSSTQNLLSEINQQTVESLLPVQLINKIQLLACSSKRLITQVKYIEEVVKHNDNKITKLFGNIIKIKDYIEYKRYGK
ncbi:Hypothetical_protein [Hexamita inflata]|uniref:Hypothetical_protein n=1 Tax=Hexamita inflata TaxID=28002 RepID=A0AA86U0D2_9EUKA|nr:Hypothetical protein HINF_LOCUS23099 [Hexamita inflata]